MAAPRVTVVGAGIIGAITAYELSRAGASVQLIDRRHEPGCGVTAQSFGWINYITADPWQAPPLYRLRRASIEKYRKLNATLGGKLFDRAAGSLVWKATDSETERWVDIHTSFGGATVLAERDAIAKLAPDYGTAPRVAAYSPDDIAIDSAHAARLLVKVAEDTGAKLMFGQSIDLIDVTEGGPADVYIGEQRVRSDFVVIAAGAASARLLSNHLPEGAVGDSPAALVTIDVERANASCILKGPDLEVRRVDESTLLAVVGAPDDESEALRQYLGQAVLENVLRRLPAIGRAKVRSVAIGRRPMPRERQPLVGPVPGASALFVAVAHPGVILAPSIGETVADLILQRPLRSGNDDLMAPGTNPWR